MPVVVPSPVLLLLSSVPHAATVRTTAATTAAARSVALVFGAVQSALTVVLSLPRAALVGPVPHWRGTMPTLGR